MLNTKYSKTGLGRAVLRTAAPLRTSGAGVSHFSSGREAASTLTFSLNFQVTSTKFFIAAHNIGYEHKRKVVT